MVRDAIDSYLVSPKFPRGVRKDLKPPKTTQERAEPINVGPYQAPRIAALRACNRFRDR